MRQPLRVLLHRPDAAGHAPDAVFQGRRRAPELPHGQLYDAHEPVRARGAAHHPPAHQPHQRLRTCDGPGAAFVPARQSPRRENARDHAALCRRRHHHELPDRLLPRPERRRAAAAHDARPRGALSAGAQCVDRAGRADEVPRGALSAHAVHARARGRDARPRQCLRRRVCRKIRCARLLLRRRAVSESGARAAAGGILRGIHAARKRRRHAAPAADGVSLGAEPVRPAGRRAVFHGSGRFGSAVSGKTFVYGTRKVCYNKRTRLRDRK